MSSRWMLLTGLAGALGFALGPAEPDPAKPLPRNLLADARLAQGFARWMPHSWREQPARIQVAPGVVVMATEDRDDLKLMQLVALRPHRRYELSARIRTENLQIVEAGGTIGANLCVYRTQTYSRSLRGTQGWTRVSLSFDSGDRTWAIVGPRFGHHGSTCTGRAEFADLSLIEVPATSAGWRPRPPAPSTGDWLREGWQPDGAVAHVDGDRVRLVTAIEDDARLLRAVPVKPRTRYRLSGEIRTERLEITQPGGRVGANLSVLDTWIHTPSVTGTTDWTPVEVTFDSGDRTFVLYGPRIGHHGSTVIGLADFRAIRVQEIPKDGL